MARQIAAVFWFALLALCLAACGDKRSPEEQVRQFLAEATAAAESRDALALRGLIADDYSDSGGRDKRGIVGIATGYFLRHKNIHLFTQTESIQFPEANRAEVRLYVAMLGSPVSHAEALLNLRADLYQFDLDLVQNSDGWLVKKARWQRATVEEMLGDYRERLG